MEAQYGEASSAEEVTAAENAAAAAKIPLLHTLEEPVQAALAEDADAQVTRL